MLKGHKKTIFSHAIVFNCEHSYRVPAKPSLLQVTCFLCLVLFWQDFQAVCYLDDPSLKSSNLLFPLWQQSTPNQTQIFKCELIYREYRIAITVRPIENLPGMWPEKALDWLSYNHATTFWLDPSGQLLHSSYQIMVMHSNFGPFVTVKLKPKSDLVIPTQYTIYQLFLPIYVTSKRDNKSDKTPN